MRCVLPGNVLFEELVGGLRTVTTSVLFTSKNAASTERGRQPDFGLVVHLRFFLLSERICETYLASIIDGLVRNINEATCQARKCAFCVRKGIPPKEVCALFGGVQPSWRHVKRVCKILKAELWRQVRLFQDWLRVVRYSLLPQSQAAQHLRWLRQQLGVLTDVRWKQVLNPLLKVFDKQRREEQKRIVVLQDAYIPVEIERWLRKGPKFAVPPCVSAHELVGLNRDLSVKANQDGDRCLQDGPLRGHKFPAKEAGWFEDTRPDAVWMLFAIKSDLEEP
ncbi:hypothetical protein HPB51_009443 [Rhipicephalus microplus]|uniref:Tick transposon n=1 Tax=Rhipicephalus microplus TaxID=6941 RepID=A0A9J6E162_RHIMP|nr:hypothetical protein HPB51_009443 [Rhipicephalus microplus]